MILIPLKFENHCCRHMAIGVQCPSPAGPGSEEPLDVSPSPPSFSQKLTFLRLAGLWVLQAEEGQAFESKGLVLIAMGWRMTQIFLGKLNKTNPQPDVNLFT